MSNVRYLNLTREKRISGSIVPYEINIDGQWVTELNNGETINIPLDYSKHKFYMRAEFPGSISLSEGLVIPEGVFDHSLYCRHKAGLTKVKLWWEIDEHQETLNNQIRQEQMHNTAIIKEINTILASIEDGKMIGCRDYSILNQLSEDAKKSPMYIKWLESTKKECFSMALKQYMDGKWGYERLFMPIRDLCTIPELKDSCKKYLKHFDYYMMSKNAVNSVLNEDNPVEEIIELSKGSRKINDHISDELSKALSCVSDYYKNGEIEKAIDSLLLVNVDVVLCQDLVQVKMRNFSHFNPPEAQPQCVFFYTIVRIHLVTYSYNGYEFVSYCRKFPDIRKSSGMPACNREF